MCGNRQMECLSPAQRQQRRDANTIRAQERDEREEEARVQREKKKMEREGFIGFRFGPGRALSGCLCAKWGAAEGSQEERWEKKRNACVVRGEVTTDDKLMEAILAGEGRKKPQ